jgi:hypothetical protein
MGDGNVMRQDDPTESINVKERRRGMSDRIGGRTVQESHQHKIVIVKGKEKECGGHVVGTGERSILERTS